MENKRLLIIDDEENMRHMLTALATRSGYEVTTAGNGREAIVKVTEQRFDFILCDVKMPVMDGIQFLAEADSLIGESTVIMMSAYGSIDQALEAMKAGAYDFISKPFKTDEVLLALKKAEEREQLRLENRRLKEQIHTISRDSDFPEMIAVSQKMKQLFNLADRVAKFDTTVLITGESGTGKELVAKGIHSRSPRKKQNFVAVNCGSLPEHLLESELFGHVKGAFTGADSAHTGLFREADGGTLLLDEVGDLPLAMQVKLLRALQEQEIRPVGSSRSVTVDVRVLAATAGDLEDLVNNNKFREDLFYRLNVVRIKIPPLRRRREDIDPLCHYFVKKFNTEFGSDVKGFNDQAQKLLRKYDWPGNVRELENVVQRGMVTTPHDFIDEEHLPIGLQNGSRRRNSGTDEGLQDIGYSLKKAQRRLERQMIGEALVIASGNKSEAARMLEISYPSLLSKIKEYNIRS